MVLGLPEKCKQINPRLPAAPQFSSYPAKPLRRVARGALSYRATGGEACSGTSARCPGGCLPSGRRPTWTNGSTPRGAIGRFVVSGVVTRHWRGNSDARESRGLVGSPARPPDVESQAATLLLQLRKGPGDCAWNSGTTSGRMDSGRILSRETGAAKCGARLLPSCSRCSICTLLARQVPCPPGNSRAV